MLEGYIGDATAGADGNPDRTTLPDGDVSDDATPGVPFAAPIRFIHDTLVDPGAPTPAAGRGPAIDFFVGLRATLAAQVEGDPDPIAAALGAYADTKEAVASIQGACNFLDLADGLSDVVECPIALVAAGFTAVIDSGEALAQSTVTTLAAAGDAILDAYFDAWIDDIDAGLAAWGELGLATTKALFDPQARRDTQNDDCGPLGAESDQVRINCEDGTGTLDVVFHESDPFINDHLLGMLGAPDFVGGLRAALQDLSDEIDLLLGPALNPIREPLADIKEIAKDHVKQAISDRFGIDIDLIKDFLSSPSSKLDVTSVNLGFGDVPLFDQDQHAKLDAYLDLPPDHHGGPGGGLDDGVVFQPERFKPYKNTTTLAKLLLLDGD